MMFRPGFIAVLKHVELGEVCFERGGERLDLVHHALDAHNPLLLMAVQRLLEEQGDVDVVQVVHVL